MSTPLMNSSETLELETSPHLDWGMESPQPPPSPVPRDPTDLTPLFISLDEIEIVVRGRMDWDESYSMDVASASTSSLNANNVSINGFRDLFEDIFELLHAATYNTAFATLSEDHGDMSLNKFAVIFFSNEDPFSRRQVLFELLQCAHPSIDWWEDVSQEMVNLLQISPSPRHPREILLSKMKWVCRRWGIEDELDVILGKAAPDETLAFWKKLVQTVKRLVKMPQAAKIMLDHEFPAGEEERSWEEVVSLGVTSAMEQGSFIKLTHTVNMETLLNNGMQSSEALEKLGSGVRTILKELDIGSHTLEENVCPMNSHDICLALQTAGETFTTFIQSYVQFMKDNDNFVRNKTEFMLFHSETGVKTLKQAMLLHRDFLKELAEYRCPPGVEDDPSWIP